MSLILGILSIVFMALGITYWIWLNGRAIAMIYFAASSTMATAAAWPQAGPRALWLLLIMPVICVALTLLASTFRRP